MKERVWVLQGMTEYAFRETELMKVILQRSKLKLPVPLTSYLHPALFIAEAVPDDLENALKNKMAKISETDI